MQTVRCIDAGMLERKASETFNIEKNNKYSNETSFINAVMLGKGLDSIRKP